MKVIITILVVAALLVGGAYAAQMMGRPEFDKLAKAVFDEMEVLASTHQPDYTAADFAQVPPVARSYLQKAIPLSGKRTRLVEIRQSGETKLTEDSSWSSFKGRQLISRDPVLTAWAHEVDYFPLLPVMTLTKLDKDTGSVRSYLWGLTDTFSNSGGMMKRYLMLRWLGEAVWHPDSLLPGNGLTWQEAENPTGSVKAARVVLEKGSAKVSGQFIFTSVGGPPMMFLADPIPYGQFAGQRWYCQYSGWRRQGKLQIPYEMVQGVRQGIGDDMRLRFKVDEIKRR